MRIRLSLVLFVLLLFAAAWGIAVVTGHAADSAQRNDDVSRAIIAREKASIDAWQHKDKAFLEDFFAEDATFFGPMNPYLEIDPKETFFPKFDKAMEMYKIEDYQMYNPRVQVYGDAAILTYNSSSMINFAGRMMMSTSKVTSVYVRQGGTWRVVHAHESQNAGAQ